jgi:hypothetical protein
MRTRSLRGEFLLGLLVATVVIGTAPHASAQGTPFVPYYGKNQIRYDNFQWYIYTTDHFEIYYYPQIEKHLERVAGYAESAYQQISADLKHDLAFKVPLIVFKTSSEFQQQNVIPGAATEGVGAFAEPTRDRMVLPIDEPPDLLYRLIVHELTHIFEFDIIPQSLIRRSVPLWVNEGLSDYMTGYWRPIDLMTVRDAAVADIVPKMTELEGYGSSGNPRLIYNLGHAVFEFMEARWGKEGIRQFLFSLRKSVIGGGDDAYEEALRLKPEEFDQQFEKYLKDRFKPFRDKERPADYGRNLAPNPEKTRYANVYSAEPSPSGDLIAAFTGNRRDQELDIVLLSAKDGSVIRNLTSGFDQDKGFEYIAVPGSRWVSVGWMSWSPISDRIAYFARTETRKSLIIQNVVNRKVEQRITMDVDEPESPAFHPNGKLVAFSALRGAVGDIYMVDLTTLQITNLTNDNFADYAPVFSPDGKSVVYLSRISGNEKLFRLDLDTKKKTQLTFGTHDDGAARFLDADTLVFSSTATSPTEPVDPEVAKNGNIFNIWTMNLKSGELREYTDAVGGNFSPAVLPGDKAPRIAFVSYYKGEYALNTLERKEPILTAQASDYGAPAAAIADFQAPLTHTIVAENKRKKGTFEKMFLEGRPPVNVGVTSGGDIFGGTQVTFTDVLGDKQFNLFAASISQYRTIAGSYVNLSRRFNYAVQGFSQTQFFYGQLGGVFYDPILSPIISRDQAIATRTVQGGNIYGIYPFNRYRRMELGAGFVNYNEEFDDPALEEYSKQYQQENFGTVLFNNGNMMPLSAAFVQETTVFREFGPLKGSTMRLAYEVAPKIGNTLSRQTLDGDARYYLRLGGSGLLALRARGFKSFGDSPDYIFFGGNSEMHGYDYLQFVGQNAFFGNAELRFPLIEAMLTPIGVLGGVRGVGFFNVGYGSFDGSGYKFSSSSTILWPTIIGYDIDQAAGTITPIYGDPKEISGFRLVDGRASYGIGLETFALGFPIHFDWSWRTLFNKDWEDALFASEGGSSAFRRAKFTVWIGYDF